MVPGGTAVANPRTHLRAVLFQQQPRLVGQLVGVSAHTRGNRRAATCKDRKPHVEEAGAGVRKRAGSDWVTRRGLCAHGWEAGAGVTAERQNKVSGKQ